MCNEQLFIIVPFLPEVRLFSLHRDGRAFPLSEASLRRFLAPTVTQAKMLLFQHELACLNRVELWAYHSIHLWCVASRHLCITWSLEWKRIFVCRVGSPCPHSCRLPKVHTIGFHSPTGRGLSSNGGWQTWGCATQPECQAGAMKTNSWNSEQWGPVNPATASGRSEGFHINPVRAVAKLTSTAFLPLRGSAFTKNTNQLWWRLHSVW